LETGRNWRQIVRKIANFCIANFCKRLLRRRIKQLKNLKENKQILLLNVHVLSFEERY
jgi:queuine/archaeosine tRNA-ribosyltransferase